MASQDIKLLIKTISDLTGLTRLGNAIRQHSKVVRGIIAVYGKLKTAAGAAFKIGASALRQVRRLGLGAAAAVGGAVREAVQFNVQMARTWTMAKWTLGEFWAMRKQVKGLATDLGVAKSELAGGLYQALSAGVPEDNVLSFIETAAKVAVADGSTIATAVDGITTVLNAFGVQADKTGEVVDQLFNTVRNGKTTFAELANNIAQAAPVAAAANMPFQELLAAVATLTKQGTPTAQAMTQIRAAILSITEELGENWREQYTFIEALEEMRKKAGESGKTLKEFMGRVEGAMAALGLTGQNARQAAADLASTADAAGALEEAFGKVDQFRHWPKLWQEIRNNVDSAGVVFDRVLKPVVESITRQLKSWRESTGVFDALEKRLTTLREKAADIWAAVTQGGEGGNLAASLGRILKAAAVMAMQAAISILLKAVPFIAEALGKGIKKAMDFGGTWAGERQTAMDIVRSRHGGVLGATKAYWSDRDAYNAEIDAEQRRLHDLNLQAEGSRLSSEFESRSGGDMGAGVAGLNAIAAEGAAIRSGKLAPAVARTRDALRANADLADEIKDTLDRIVAEQNSIRAWLQTNQSQLRNSDRAGGQW